jgi:hypothetical protein
MSEFYGIGSPDELDMARLKPLSGIIAVQEWYDEKLSYAEAEYRTAADGLAKSPQTISHGNISKKSGNFSFRVWYPISNEI